MSDETERAKEIDEAVKASDAKKRADAEEAANQGEKIDKILASLDAFGSAVDSLGKRLDAYDAERKPKGEEGESGDMVAEVEKDKPKPLAADSRMVRKDSAADAEEIEFFKREIGATHAVSADSILAAIQGQADRASSAWGKDAKHPWDGEGITAYRRRVARGHQINSPIWKDVDLSTLSGQALRNATAQIFADSIAASSAPDSYGETLREVRRRNPDTGHLIKEYYGSPRAWMSQFTGGRRLAKFNLNAIHRRDH